MPFPLVGAVQFRPVWLDRAATTARLITTIESAAARGIALLAFPEACLAGYPFWLCRTNGAAFDDRRQQRAYAQFLDAAVEADSPELSAITADAHDHRISICLGFNERGRRAGRGTVYCSLATIDAERGLVGIHRKLMPTHDERLCWGIGDARDLKVHALAGLRVGALNCWENWMPLARYALYRDGEELHVSVWPGSPSVSRDAPRLAALEGRVWSVVASGVLAIADVADDFEFKADLVAASHDPVFSGGSVIIDPTGVEVAHAMDDTESIIAHVIDPTRVGAGRQSFDPTGHYSRADLFTLAVRRERPDESDAIWTEP